MLHARPRTVTVKLTASAVYLLVLLCAAFDGRAPATEAQALAEFLGACWWSEHPILGVATSLTTNRFNLYWVHHRVAARGRGAARPAIRSSKSVPANVAWRFIADWLRMADSREDYALDEDRLASRKEYREGLSLLKDAIQGSVAGTPMSDDMDSLTEQLQMVSMLPHDERLEAALDIMHSHFPMGLPYYT